MKESDEQITLTPDQAAFVLGKSANTIRYHQREGNLPAQITVADVVKLLDDEVKEATRRRDRGRRIIENLFLENA